jgi:hypothetical protein
MFQPVVLGISCVDGVRPAVCGDIPHFRVRNFDGPNIVPSAPIGAGEQGPPGIPTAGAPCVVTPKPWRSSGLWELNLPADRHGWLRIFWADVASALH